MKRKLPVIAISLLLAFACAHAEEGQDNAAVMAKILMGVNHYPSSAEKKTLQAIIDDANNDAHTKALARAIMNMEHSIAAGDRSEIESIASDSSAEEGEKKLAQVLGSFKHKASADQMKVLKSIE